MTKQTKPTITEVLKTTYIVMFRTQEVDGSEEEKIIYRVDPAKSQLKTLVTEALKEVVGEDELCEKNHKEYFEWCSYCNLVSADADLRQKQLNNIPVIVDRLFR